MVYGDTGRGTREVKKLLLGAILLIAGVAIANALLIMWPALEAKRNDSRSADVGLYAHYAWGVNPNVLVLNIVSLEPAASMADVDRVLLDTAEAFKKRNFSKVVLAYRGHNRFQFDGAYFRRVGEERSWQNPVYTIRTMSENVEDLDGSPAFGTWTGGWLGVMGKQMEDHRKFHQRWYIDDLMKG
ncbi:hypothetical protein IB276_35685 [Ensifer sp. ENS04]|uniref:hypothetical protein n=1 Tax=Ensifer sp. ENS04 TaxID=2769281 RepID=UPI001780755D|nr:hypothetical protein [Ensifer sp. ENS04]MBD9544775.1 hypothetical protein [Ensifer sp. ENS04]